MNFNKLPRDNAKHIKLNVPKIEPIQHFEFLENIENPMSSILRSVYANIVDMTDKTICEAVIKYAKNQGATDLYILDRDFVKRALINEAKRQQKLKTNFDKITESVESLAEFIDSLNLIDCNACVGKSICDCHIRDCKDVFIKWLQKEIDDEDI